MRDLLLVGAVCVAPLTSAAALAQSAAPTGPATVALLAGDEVAAYYNGNNRAIWTRGGVNEAAVTELIRVLQKAPFDGFADGPQLATEVQAAIAQARSGDPSATAAAERTLSNAWVRYVQALKRPTQGMIYAIPALRPEGGRVNHILLTAAAAPSLARYIDATASVNPIYSQLREAAWAEAQAS